MPSVTGDVLAGDATKLTKNAQNTAKPSSSLHQVMQRYAPQRQWVEWSRCPRARTSPCSRQRRWEQRKHVFAALKGWLLAARLGVDSGNRLHLPRTKLLARTSKNILTHTSCYALCLKFTSVHRICPRMRMPNQHNTKPRVSPALHNRV